MTRRASASLVLCCAEEGEVRLVDLIDTLHADGLSPEVLAGIDADPDLLTTAVDRQHGAALFVLCQTPELDRATVRRLSGLFSARRGPEHHILTVDLSAGRTPAAIRDIERALDDVGVVRVGGEESEERFMRDVVGPTAVDALGNRSFIPEPTVDPEQLARELAEGLDAAARMLERKPDPRRRRTPLPRRPQRPIYPGGQGPLPAMPGLVDDDEIAASTEPLEQALERATIDPAAGVAAHRARALAATAAARAATGVPTLVEDDHPVIGGGVGDPSGSHLGAPVPRVEVPPHFDSPAPRLASPPPGYDSPAPSVGPPSGRLTRSASGGHGRATASGAFDGAPEPATDSGPRARMMEEEAADMARPRRLPQATGAHARPGGRLLLLVAAAGMIALLGMAIMQMAFDDPGLGPDARRAPDPSTKAAKTTKATPAAASQAGARPGPAARTPQPQGEREAPTPAGADAKAEPAPTDSAPAEPAPDPETDEPSGADDAGVPPDPKDDAKATAPTETAEPAPSPHGTTPPPPPKPAGTAAKLASAIADGKVKVVGDDLYVLTGLPRDTTTWDTADARCRARKIDGVAGWRLPSKRQARTLQRAGVLATGTFWTRATVGEDEVVAFDAATGRMNQWLTIEPNARTVCVRTP